MQIALILTGCTTSAPAPLPSDGSQTAGPTVPTVPTPSPNPRTQVALSLVGTDFYGIAAQFTGTSEAHNLVECWTPFSPHLCRDIDGQQVETFPNVRGGPIDTLRVTGQRVVAPQSSALDGCRLQSPFDGTAPADGLQVQFEGAIIDVPTLASPEDLVAELHGRRVHLTWTPAGADELEVELHSRYNPLAVPAAHVLHVPDSGSFTLDLDDLGVDPLLEELEIYIGQAAYGSMSGIDWIVRAHQLVALSLPSPLTQSGACDTLSVLEPGVLYEAGVGTIHLQPGEALASEGSIEACKQDLPAVRDLYVSQEGGDIRVRFSSPGSVEVLPPQPVVTLAQSCDDIELRDPGSFRTQGGAMRVVVGPGEVLTVVGAQEAEIQLRGDCADPSTELASERHAVTWHNDTPNVAEVDIGVGAGWTDLQVDIRPPTAGASSPTCDQLTAPLTTGAHALLPVSISGHRHGWDCGFGGGHSGNLVPVRLQPGETLTTAGEPLVRMGCGGPMVDGALWRRTTSNPLDRPLDLVLELSPYFATSPSWVRIGP